MSVSFIDFGFIVKVFSAEPVYSPVPFTVTFAVPAFILLLYDTLYPDEITSPLNLTVAIGHFSVPS